MTILKCKMCGGNLQINEEMSVCECEYCGTKQTIPKADDEQKINAMNRANHFRRQCEFDKAIEVYEKVLHTFGEDAELFWALALCKYGIEYVDDPLTRKKIPTCHRMQYTSILDDVDYIEAISRADEIQKILYKEEAETISAIQKRILDISNKEAPFDVFICYKESDENNSRTQDSVLAQDIYYGLTEKGFKVFFSRITLEGKLGTAYEPYIFAALNSAKVMIVVGTKPEYVNAVWVKNEWSRFLLLMKEDKHKLIIPAYRDMDPYDLPDALSVYQSQDMSKLGFMQDLIRGVSKVLDGEKEKEGKSESSTLVTPEIGTNLAALLKRGNFALEDGEWDRAFDFFDQVLNSNAECADAYVGQFCARNKVTDVEELIIKLLKDNEEATPTTHSLKITEEQMNNIQKMLKENCIERVPYTAEEVATYSYVTYSESRIQQKEQMLEFFNTDKLLKKAIRFSKDEGAEFIGKIQSGIIPIMDSRIAEAQAEDEKAKTELEMHLTDIYQTILDRINHWIEDKEKRYQQLVEGYKTGNIKMTYGQLKREFLSFGDYKEAAKYVKEVEEQRRALEDERRVIMNSFQDLGVFAKKKRAELERRLKEVNEKIEKFNNNK